MFLYLCSFLKSSLDAELFGLLDDVLDEGQLEVLEVDVDAEAFARDLLLLEQLLGRLLLGPDVQRLEEYARRGLVGHHRFRFAERRAASHHLGQHEVVLEGLGRVFSSAAASFLLATGTGGRTAGLLLLLATGRLGRLALLVLLSVGAERHELVLDRHVDARIGKVAGNVESRVAAYVLMVDLGALLQQVLDHVEARRLDRAHERRRLRDRQRVYVRTVLHKHFDHFEILEKK